MMTRARGPLDLVCGWARFAQTSTVVGARVVRDETKEEK